MINRSALVTRPKVNSIGDVWRRRSPGSSRSRGGCERPGSPSRSGCRLPLRWRPEASRPPHQGRVSAARRRGELRPAARRAAPRQLSILQCRGEFPDHANIDLASPRSSFAADDGCRGDERLHMDDPNQIGRVRVVGRVSGGPGSPRRPVRLPGVSPAVAAPLPVGRLR
jgi:hypothetical protein